MTNSPPLPEIEPAALGLSLSGAALPLFKSAPRNALGPIPPRRPGSVRRTMSLDVDWPRDTIDFTRLTGNARDILSEHGTDVPTVLASTRIEAHAAGRVILDVVADPPRPELAALAGARAGGSLRGAIDLALPGERGTGSLLHLLLDDLAGVTLVGSWAWAAWDEEAAILAERGDMTGVCIGFRPGSGAISSDEGHVDRGLRVASLINPADPAGWHPFHEGAPKNFRRARWIDVWRDDEGIRVEAGFQDTASCPDGGDRLAIHEYRLAITADRDGILRHIDARPGTLPYKECPAAVANIDLLRGIPLEDLRPEVPRLLRRTAGCTHLNDALRALADVPSLVAHLPD